MGNRIGEKIKLTSIDELLCVPETVGTVEIELGLISEFANHPFRVVDDEKMDELVESIKQQGILSPVLVRPGKDSGYEMVSGHRIILFLTLQTWTVIGNSKTSFYHRL